MEEQHIIRSLAALAQTHRLKVFRQLVVAGGQGLTPSSLAEALELPAATLSFHLKELSHAGLVTQERMSRNLVYRADFAHMNALLAYLTENCCQGQGCGPGAGASGAASASGSKMLHNPQGNPMTQTPYHVLFVCTGNSARSIMAEGLLNHLGEGRFKAFSAGSHPTGSVHPMALETLAWLNLPIEGHRSKRWDEFAGPDAVALDFVFTVCDKAAGEICPVWPGQPITAHWGLPDPAAVKGSHAQQLQAFHDTAMALKRRIELMLALPMSALDTMSLQLAVRGIGQA